MVFKYFSFLTIWYYYKLVQLSGHLLTAYGYGAPEFESGIYTHQSDVYSLGVVMLELLTGRQSYDRWECKPNTCHPFSGFHPVSWFMYSKHLGQDTHSRGTVSSKMGNSQLHDIDALSSMVDPSLNGEYPAKSLSNFADIISRCVQVNSYQCSFQAYYAISINWCYLLAY